MRDKRISISNFLGVLLLLLLIVFPMYFMSIVNAFEDDVKITEVSQHPLPAGNLNKENSRNKRSVLTNLQSIRDAGERAGESWAWPVSTDSSRTIVDNSGGDIIHQSFRNEFSRLFLSVMGQYGMEHPWSSYPRQHWKFLKGGWLRNDEGKCLAGSGWYIHTVLCDYELGNNARWTHTAFRQIKSADGYCLSSSAGSRNDGYVYYDYCRDEAGQRWWEVSL